MPISVRKELERIDREILRLQAQRELLLRLVDSGTLELSDVDPVNPSNLPRSYPVRPKNPEYTDAILKAVKENPGLTIREIAELVGKEMSASEQEVTKLYNTAYGLARRGRIVKDASGRVSSGE